ncbi:hypothetical protein [Runella sp.]|nr:hypothetical protein [Runella sp.]
MESISLVSAKLASVPKIGKWQRQFIYCSSNCLNYEYFPSSLGSAE